jgi:hypothetical protein
VFVFQKKKKINKETKQKKKQEKRTVNRSNTFSNKYVCMLTNEITQQNG